jgi:hypothetical protein
MSSPLEYDPFYEYIPVSTDPFYEDIRTPTYDPFYEYIPPQEEWTPPTGLPPANTPTGIDNEGGDLTGGIGGWWNGLTTAVKNTFLKKDASGRPIQGEYDIGKILTAGGGALGGLAGLMGANKPTTTPSGYQGGIPQLTAVRTALPQPTRTPYTGQPAMGRRYFTDTQYVAPAQAAATSQSQATQANAISQQQAERDQGLAKLNKQMQQPPRGGFPALNRITSEGVLPNQTPSTQNFNQDFSSFGFDKGLVDYLNQQRTASETDGGVNYSYDPNTKMFMGGTRGNPNITKSLAEMQAAAQPVQAAQGGLMAAKGTYLRGSTDGMADELNTSIEGKQPAKLSHGEFVVPADVVSHLGNGNSDAGAKKLYQMMDRIRVARTGTKKQGKEINPDKFMPGGKVGYAEGGIAKFVAGGPTSNVPSGTALAGGLTGSESSLSNWAGPYVTNMLAQGQALANQPYQAYTGQLTAGTSPLQQQAFQGAAGLATPTNMGGFTPQSFTGQGTAQQYMNPYLQQALDPQLAEARRQSQITQTQNAGKLTGAGAYGGGRQAIMDAETQRNLATNLANITGQGYSTAYDKAMQQFNVEQQAAQQAQNLTNQYGLNVLGQQAGLGQVQRGIESEAVAADRNQFEEERLNPYKMVQFQSSLLSGLPLAAQTYNTAQPSWLQSLGSGALFGSNSTNAILETLGIIPKTTPAK